MTDRQPDHAGEPIAVIGLAGRFPGASSVDELWRNLREGVDGISRPDPDQLRSLGVTDEELRHPDYVRAVALLPDADRFDAELFSMTPREAKVHSPLHRIFLEVVHAALENAGYDPFAVPASTGVFGGSSSNGYLQYQLWDNPAVASLDPMTLGVANNSSYVPTLTSYKLSLRGPSVAVATACSTSLVALHLAVGSLREGSCGMAVAGAVEVEFPYGHGYRWAPGSAYSRLGVCRPFDAEADGTIFGSGAGVVVLKRLRDAVADGDTVRAVIRGTAVNNDGADKVSFSAPSVSGQTAVIKAALANAGVDPARIGYVEAHGTGTRLGDPLEVAALSRAYTEMATDPLPAGGIRLGSVKSNIGHLGAAAGVAGLIKAVTVLEHGQIPPTIHYRTPNPEIDFPTTPFVVNDQLHEWRRTPGRPRYAAVSSFGVGGTNAHVVLEEPPLPPKPAGAGRPRLLLWSARSDAPLEAVQAELATYLAGPADGRLDDVAYTSQVGRTHHPLRAAAVGATTGEAAEILRTGRGVLRRRGQAAEREICLAFPGQGSQQPRMAAGLYRHVPRFAAVLDECLDLFAEAGLDLRDLWHDGAIDHTSIAQPLLFSVELALAHALLDAGVQPRTVFGHSLGELVAATFAGVFDLPDAVRLVAVRGQSMGDMPPGQMLAVPRDPAELGDLATSGVVVAAVNGPRQCVLSGPEEAMAELRDRLADRNIGYRILRTSHAFHSPSMAPAAERFLAAVRRANPRPPTIRLVSAATGTEVSAEQAVSAEFWARQLVEPVRFGAAIDHVLACGPQLVIEAGPARVLTGLLQAHRAVRDGESGVVPAAPAVADEEADLRAFLATLGAVHVDGHDLRWTAQLPGRRLPLPGYQYQRQRYWMERPAAETAPTSRLSVVGWEHAPAVGPVTAPAGRRALALLPAAAAEAATLLAALYRAGYDVLCVRPGEELKLGDGEFVVRPAVPGDLTAVLDELANRGMAPHTLVHAWTATQWTPPAAGSYDGQLADGCLSLFELARAGLRRPVDGALPAFVAITSGGVDVSGDEPVHPMKAMLLGAVATLRQEVPGTRCQVIDIGARIDGDLLTTELLAHEPPTLVALRGSCRWVPTERPLDLATRDHTVLRDGGVYVITGGLGGIGLELARGLARTGLRPRLALLGRRVPDGTPLLPEPDAGRVRAAVLELEALGASVRIEACDVADEATLYAALDRVTAAFGPVNGVIHGAGVAGDGVIQLRQPADAQRVWRPKVLGTLLLHEYLRTRPRLDFFVACSSRAGTHGLVGSGDYAAANAFLDAHAVSAWPGTRALSIGWPGWLEVGMAARSSVDTRPGDVLLDEVLDPATHWVLDEHRVDGIAVLPGSGQVDLVVRAWWGSFGQGPIRLEDVTFLRPLAADGPVRVQVVGTGPGSFAVRSYQSDRGWIDHATGKVRSVEGSARSVDLAALEARIAAQEPPSAGMVPGVVTAGPRWKHVGRQARGRDEDLLELVLPDEFRADLAVHPLHPALFDGAMATAQRNTGLPLMYRALTIFGVLPAQFWVHLRYRSAEHYGSTVDADLIGPDGRVLVAAEGFLMRPVDRDTLTAELRTKAAPAPRRPGVLAGGGGLAPRTGVETFLRLLNARTPAHVLVNPDESRQRPAAPPPVTPKPVAVSGVPDVTAISTTIRTFWAEVTGIDGVGDHDDFFELGGTSLTAIQLMSQVRDWYGIELGIALLFECPTVALLAEAIHRQLDA